MLDFVWRVDFRVLNINDVLIIKGMKDLVFKVKI
jgi:hypothetical protein